MQNGFGEVVSVRLSVPLGEYEVLWDISCGVEEKMAGWVFPEAAQMNDVVLSDGNQCDVHQSDHLCLAYPVRHGHHYMDLCARRTEQDERHGRRLCQIVAECPQ